MTNYGLAIAQHEISRLERLNPDAVRLGEFVSLAVRVEPELLRVARLHFLKKADVSAEADLWLSLLIDDRTTNWFVFSNDATKLLRRRIALDEIRLQEARNFIADVHKGVTPIISLEEEIIWQSISPGNDETKINKIDSLLKGVLAKIVESPDTNSGLVRWFASAVSRLPEIAVKTEAYQLMLFVASAHLDGRFIDEPGWKHPSLYQIVAQSLPKSVSYTQIWVAYTSEGLSIRSSEATGFKPIKVPTTCPLLLELRSWNRKSRIIAFRKNNDQNIALEPGELEIVTLSGTAYRLLPNYSGSASNHFSSLHPSSVDPDSSFPFIESTSPIDLGFARETLARSQFVYGTKENKVSLVGGFEAKILSMPQEEMRPKFVFQDLPSENIAYLASKPRFEARFFKQ